MTREIVRYPIKDEEDIRLAITEGPEVARVKRMLGTCDFRPLIISIP